MELEEQGWNFKIAKKNENKISKLQTNASLISEESSLYIEQYVPYSVFATNAFIALLITHHVIN